MPSVFVYEHVTAVGLGREPDSPHHSLWVEGRAMRDAISADFAAVPDVEVLSFPDDLPEADLLPTFRELAKRADWSFVLAPETGGELERLTREVAGVGGRLLGPSADAIALTADKLRLAEWWEVHGVPTPRTVLVNRGCEPAGVSCTTRGFTPAVHQILKPRDGAGSESTFLARTPTEYAAALEQSSGPMIAQEYVAGRPASVAFLVGPTQTVPLLPTFQVLSTDDRFRYEGGQLPIPPELAERAVRLGTEAINCVPGLFGYVGVDLILGEHDTAVEINPRLTTSYVGLRALAAGIVAGWLLAVAEGRAADVSWQPGRIHLHPAGRIGREAAPTFWG